MMLLCISSLIFFFFFSSRRRHTRSLRDWSSDVCSSDLFSYDELHLGVVVQSLLLQHKVVGEAVVKDAKARAQHGLGRLLSTSINAPGEAKTRRKIDMVTDVVLTLVAQSVAEGDIWFDAPIVLSVQASIKISHIGKGATGGDRILTRTPTRSDNLRHRHS